MFDDKRIELENAEVHSSLLTEQPSKGLCWLCEEEANRQADSDGKSETVTSFDSVFERQKTFAGKKCEHVTKQTTVLFHELGLDVRNTNIQNSAELSTKKFKGDQELQQGTI